MVSDLFQDLRPFVVQTEGKPSLHENLLDVLEVVAVAQGLRPAHLQGNGFRDARRLEAFEQIARRHRLATLRTKRVTRRLCRAPEFERELADWITETEAASQQADPDVLWVFRKEGLEQTIARVVVGEARISDALGYPIYCVERKREQFVVLAEAYAQGIKSAYRPTSPEKLVKLWKDSVQVSIAVDVNPLTECSASMGVFPYTQLSACPACKANITTSPAAIVNRQMRDLAFSLSLEYGQEIWRARDSALATGPARQWGRNDPCPCTSGRKFKKCCA
jgi:hypothetical protein